MGLVFGMVWIDIVGGDIKFFDSIVNLIILGK